MATLRTKGKSTIVWVLVGMLVLGLGGFGVTSFGGGRAEVGRVGETKITVGDYARTLQNQMNSYSAQTGQTFTLAQAQAVGLPQQVQSQLFTAAALSEEARKIGLSVGDQRVADTILTAQTFQGPTGKFDRVAYGEMLRRQGMDEARFEAEVRKDLSRLLMQRAVAQGVNAPTTVVDQTVGWMLEARDVTWREVTAGELSEAVVRPDEDTLKAWHQANADRFTAPELRKITYVWLTPEMLSDQVKLDEAALRAEYDRRINEFQQPERRMVGRLVFQDEAAATAAKARLDAGDVPFEALVMERGLTLDDIDLGEVTKEQLGAAGDGVFGLDQPGIVGPFDSDLGPALFSMNAILDPVEVSFEQAQEELRGEAAIDRARRMIEDRAGEFEDMLASGASLEDLAKDSDMELGQIEFDANAAPQHTGIDGYQAFRERATTVTAEEFPQLYQLDDGGVFALRLDAVVPPALRPFETVTEEVATDWIASETRGRLLALAEELVVNSAAEPAAEAAAAPASVKAENLTPDGWIDGAPQALVTRAFAVAEPGETQVVDAEDRVFLLTLDAVHPADLASVASTETRDAVSDRLNQSLQNDLFEYYVRQIQGESGVQVNQSAIEAALAMVR